MITTNTPLWAFSIFLFDTIIIQSTGKHDMQVVAAAQAPDLSAARAIQNFTLLIPSAFPGALALFTFGTTKHFRDTMHQTFVPTRWRQRLRLRRRGPAGAQGEQSRGRETPPIGTTAGSTGPGRGLGRRFADRGSWTAAVSANASGTILHLEDLDGPSEPVRALRASAVHSTSEEM